MGRYGTAAIRLVESVISASVIVLVIRIRRAFFTNSPGRYLVLATRAVAGTTLLLPYLPIAAQLELTPMPPSFLLLLSIILASYVMTAELVKQSREAEQKDQGWNDDHSAAAPNQSVQRAHTNSQENLRLAFYT